MLCTVNSEFFVRILFFANSVKMHICDVKNSRLRHDLPQYISVNDRVILPLRFAKIKPSQNFRFYSIKIDYILVY